MEHPNTVSGLVSKRDELVRYREQLETAIRNVTCDIDHLEAAIRIFDPDAEALPRHRYAALHRAPKGQSTRFIMAALKASPAPLSSRQLADMWCRERGLEAKDSTISMIRKRMGATLKALHKQNRVRQDGFVDGLIGWRVA